MPPIDASLAAICGPTGFESFVAGQPVLSPLCYTPNIPFLPSGGARRTQPSKVEEVITMGLSGLAGFLAAAGQQRQSTLERAILVGAGALRSFLPQEPQILQTPVPDVPIRPAGTQPGLVRAGGCSVVGKTGKMRRGRTVVIRQPDGSLALGCAPSPRRMNPCNPKAARRAVRRLSSVHSFMKSIERQIAQTCRQTTPRRRSTKTVCCK